MQTPREYAKQKAMEGNVASIIVRQDVDVWWLYDGDWNLLKGPPHKTQEKALDARRAAINWADQFWVEPSP